MERSHFQGATFTSWKQGLILVRNTYFKQIKNCFKDNTHLKCLAYSWCSSNSLKTMSKCCTCFSQEFIQISISSKNTNTHFLGKVLKNRNQQALKCARCIDKAKWCHRKFKMAFMSSKSFFSQNVLFFHFDLTISIMDILLGNENFSL